MVKYLLILQKKNLFYLALGLFCAVLLGCSIGWMEQFQNISQYYEYQYNTGSYIAYFSGNLSEQDIAVIAADQNVEQCGVVTYYKKIVEGKGKDFWIRGADANYMLRNSVVSQGRLPEKRNELTAERWVLETLGAEPKAGTEIEFVLEDEAGNHFRERFVVSGILSDSAYAKENGKMNLFIPADLEEDIDPIVNLDIRQGADLAESLEAIQAKLGAEDVFYEFSSEAGAMRRSMGSMKAVWGKSLLTAGLFCIYLVGICRLGKEQFQKELAKLRMCGFSVRMVILSLAKLWLAVYAVCTLAGTACAMAAVTLLTKAAGLDRIHFIFWGESRHIQPEILTPMFLLTLLLLLAVLLAVCIWIGFEGTRRSILSQMREGQNARRCACRMKEKKGKWSGLYFRVEWVSVGMAVLAGVVFLTMDYLQLSEKRMEENEIFSQCRNGDFQITGFQQENILNGVSREKLEEITALEGTARVDAAMTLPVRVRLEDDIVPASDYYDTYNEYAKDLYYREFLGTEPASGDTVYKSTLMGYNDSALNRLDAYLCQGKIDVEQMKTSNTAVLFVPQYVEGRFRQRFYSNARQVMDYEPGDRITVKIRDDYETDMESYWAMEDQISSHEEVFEIAAVVYYPYLPNTSAMGLVNPDVIISDARMRELTGQQTYRVVNIDLDDGFDEKAYEIGLSDCLETVPGITVSNLISARMEKEMRSRIYAVLRIMWSLLAGAGLAVCALNGFRQHIRQRKGELRLCRMIGFSQKELLWWADREGLCYFAWTSTATLALAYLLQYRIYTENGNQVMGLSFWGHEGFKLMALVCCFAMTRILFEKMTRRMIRSGIMENRRED